MKKYIKFLITLLLSLSVLFFIVKQFEIEALINEIKKVNLPKLILSTFFLLSFMVTFTAKRMALVLNSLGQSISFGQAINIYLAVLPISKISPGNAGDIVRGLYMKDQLSISKNTGALIYERINDILALATLSLVFSQITKNYYSSFFSFFIVFIIILLIFILPKTNKQSDKVIIKKLHSLLSIFRVIKNQKKTMLLVFFYSILNWSAMFFFIQYVYHLLGITVSLPVIASLQPLVIFTSLIPITFSGLGTREGAMLFLYKDIIPQSTILSTSLIYSFISVIILPLLGLPFMLHQFKKKIEK